MKREKETGRCKKRENKIKGRLLKPSSLLQLYHRQLAARFSSLADLCFCSASPRLASATPLLYGLFVPAEVVAQWEHYARDQPFVD